MRLDQEIPGLERVIQNFVFEKKWQWARHSLFWLFLYLDEVLSFFGITPPLEVPWLLAVEFGLDVIIVYLNIYWLIPRFLLKKRYSGYIILTVLSLLLSTAINGWTESFYFEYEYPLSANYGGILFTLSVLGTAVAVKLGKQSILQQQKQESSEKERIKAELNYLKDQINPHFLFNMLNTLYVESKTNSKIVPDMVMKLSDLLRYQIYDASNRETIPLKQELNFLKNYIELEQMRRDQLDLDWNVEGDPTGIEIAPLIFLPLVENAVKHSRSTEEGPDMIRISFTIIDHKVSCLIENSIGMADSDEPGGFGLENLRRRLELTYPGKHQLLLESKDGTFMAELTAIVNEVPDRR